MGRSSIVRHDPIDMELTDVAKEGFGSNHSREQPRNGTSSDNDNMFAYDSAVEEIASLSESDRFNHEEHMIDILANVDCDIDEHMVVHEEDSLTKTIAGVAGNVLEWWVRL